MSEARVLQIYFERQRVGHLLEEQDIWTLKYDVSWSKSAQAFDIGYRWIRIEISCARRK